MRVGLGHVYRHVDRDYKGRPLEFHPHDRKNFRRPSMLGLRPLVLAPYEPIKAPRDPYNTPITPDGTPKTPLKKKKKKKKTSRNLPQFLFFPPRASAFLAEASAPSVFNWKGLV